MIRILGEIAVTLSAFPALSLLAKSTLVATVGVISTWFVRRRRAALRHALLASTFSVLLALPIVSFLATPVPITVPVAKGDNNISPLFDYVSVAPPGTPTAERFSAATVKSGWTLHSLATLALPILLWGWCLGTALFVLQIVRGALQIRSLRRFGRPWRQGQLLAEALAPNARRRVEVLLHDSLPGPVTYGVIHPLVILPADAQSWEEPDLERALVHEMEHVRRNDWAVHCLARIACAVYWFHPLVWTAWRQLTLAAERSCDDAVLRNSDATAYADQLVGLARKRSSLRRSPALAMASRSDLAARVSALLDGSQRRGPVGALLIFTSCIVATVTVFTMSPLRVIAAPQDRARTDASSIPKWEAVSIKPCSGDQGTPDGTNLSPGRIVLNCDRLVGLVNGAYIQYAGGKKNALNAISTTLEGFPDWATSERYRIEAKAEGNPEQYMMYGPMLQALLENRFRLKVHRETREGTVYILSVGKGGTKMTTPPPGNCTTVDYRFQDNGAAPPPPPVNPCPYSGDKPPYKAIDGWMNMDTLALLLERTGTLDAPLLNKTSLAGAYHVQLQWMNQNLAPATQETDLPLGPSIFTAVQKLGLKIEAGKGPRQFLVFDHAERPSEN